MTTKGPDSGAVNVSSPQFLWGVRAIAGKINRSERQTYHLLATNSLRSVKRVGHRYVADVNQLLAELRANEL